MVRFRARTRVSQTVKAGPYRFKIRKRLGRGGLRSSAGTRPWRRARLSFSPPARRIPPPQRPQAPLAVTPRPPGMVSL